MCAEEVRVPEKSHLPGEPTSLPFSTALSTYSRDFLNETKLAVGLLLWDMES